MKKVFLLLITIVSILFLSENRIYAHKQDTTIVADTITGQEYSETKEAVVIISEVSSVTEDDTVAINGVKICFKQAPQKEWYQKDWAQIGLIVVAIIALILALFAHIAFKFATTDKDEVLEMIRAYYSKHGFISSQTSDEDISALRNEVAKLSHKINELQKFSPILSQRSTNHVQSVPIVDNPDKTNTTQQQVNTSSVTHPSVHSQKQDLKKKDKKKDKQVALKKKYATQDASNQQRLMNVSDTFDKYEHTFVITLDSGSETEGSFQLVDDESVIQDCLNNTDSLLCCVKDGTGTKIAKQVPGRVSINGDIADVKSMAQIFLKNV